MQVSYPAALLATVFQLYKNPDKFVTLHIGLSIGCMFVFNLQSEENATISLDASILPACEFGATFTPSEPLLILTHPLTSNRSDGHIQLIPTLSKDSDPNLTIVIAAGVVAEKSACK